MLRGDCCFPSTEKDSEIIIKSFDSLNDMKPRFIEIKKRVKELTDDKTFSVDRWNTIGCKLTIGESYKV